MEGTIWVCERCGEQWEEAVDAAPSHCESCFHPHLESFTAHQVEDGDADAFSRNVSESRAGCFA
jgi:hypothetical protein